MTIYYCAYKTITNPKKIDALLITDNSDALENELLNYDNALSFTNLSRTVNMLKDNGLIPENVTYDSIQKRLRRKGQLYIRYAEDISEHELVLLKIKSCIIQA